MMTGFKITEGVTECQSFFISSEDILADRCVIYIEIIRLRLREF
jgi:hypothetical protein